MHVCLFSVLFSCVWVTIRVQCVRHVLGVCSVWCVFVQLWQQRIPAGVQRSNCSSTELSETLSSAPDPHICLHCQICTFIPKFGVEVLLQGSRHHGNALTGSGICGQKRPSTFHHPSGAGVPRTEFLIACLLTFLTLFSLKKKKIIDCIN